MANIIEGYISGKNLKFGIVAARFNEVIVSKLVGGALDTPLLAFLNFALPSFQAQIPPLLFALANICALAAIKLRYAALGCAIIGISPIFFIT